MNRRAFFLTPFPFDNKELNLLLADLKSVSAAAAAAAAAAAVNSKLIRRAYYERARY